MIKTPILVVGAGPTGLMLSAQLLRYGAPHVVIDKKDSVTELSKALVVQARTLEYYQQLGISRTAAERGFVADTIRLIVNSRVRAHVPLGEIGKGLSPFPYLFVLEQSENEALILEEIAAGGGKVHWGTALAEVQQTPDGYTGTLTRHDGRTEAFECQYLIGCDGAGSRVRRFLGTPFRGGTNEQLFFVADIDMEIGLDKEGLLLAINQGEFLGFFPMARPQQYRAIGVLPPTVPDIENIPFSTLKDHIEQNVGLPINIVGHAWHAGYRVHHRIVDCFRSGNAFLVGDAAHIHSPAGGQGMNTGLGGRRKSGLETCCRRQWLERSRNSRYLRPGTAPFRCTARAHDRPGFHNDGFEEPICPLHADACPSDRDGNGSAVCCHKTPYVQDRFTDPHFLQEQFVV